MSRSLRTQLLVWVLAPVACAVAVNGYLTHSNAFATASVAQDALLLGAVRIIAEQLRFEDGSFEGHIPPAALELFQGRPDRIYHRTTTHDGKMLFGYTELALPATPLLPEQPLFFDSTARGEAVRVVAFQQPVIGGPEGDPVIVEVAQTMNAHDDLARALWLHAVWQQVALMLLVTVLILFGLRRGLLPVLALRDAVRGREAGTLQPLQEEAVPSELSPLVVAINDYSRRLTQYTQAQRVFIQNAAHQLRTPFTLLQTQTSFALRTTDMESRNESLVAIRRTVHQSVRLVNQLLALSAAESRTQGDRPARSADTRGVVQQVLEALSALAEARHIDLGLEETGGPSRIEADTIALREIMLNLVDNAIRYTQPGGVVTVKIGVEPGAVVVTVEDNGPGIAPDQRERVFERFYRLQDGDSDGCGLGLAVVRELAASVDARVDLQAAPGGQGLAARVRFKACAAAAAHAAVFPGHAATTSEVTS